MSVHLCSSKNKISMNGLHTLSGDRLRRRTWWDLHVSPILLVSCTESKQLSPEVSQETALVAAAAAACAHQCQKKAAYWTVAASVVPAV